MTTTTAGRAAIERALVNCVACILVGALAGVTVFVGPLAVLLTLFATGCSIGVASWAVDGIAFIWRRAARAVARQAQVCRDRTKTAGRRVDAPGPS